MNESRLILLVEDDRVDAMTVIRALKEIHAAWQVETAGNGEEALALLRDSRREQPGLILLDVNMPRMNGIEFLRVLKQDSRLRRIPVIMLTTSREEQDRLASFDLSVAGYMIKPLEYGQFLDMMGTIDRYWNTSELPDS